jgi:hypothetical protein
MANAYKVLGQVEGAASNTNLYTVPSSTEAVISTIIICNRTTSAKSYRIMVRPDNETLATKHYLAYDVAIAANDTTALTLGITMNAADKLDIYSSDTNLTFAAFGSEITA